jgi:hypothetical protein
METYAAVVGHLERHAPGALATTKMILGDAAMEPPLPEAPEADHLKAMGASMDRHDIVTYTLSQLDRSITVRNA